MAKYRVETEDGKAYEVETEDTQPASPAHAASTDPRAQIGHYIADTVSNIPSSAFNIAKGLYQGIRHPYDTGAALVKTAAGLAQKVSTPDSPSPSGADFGAHADAAIHGAKDRYGSLGALANTVKTDPVGVAADVSTVAGGIGGLARSVTSGARALSLPRVATGLTRVAEGASAVSDAANPIKFSGKLISKIPVPDKLTPSGMYASALKIPPAIKGGVPERDRIISTGIREGIPVSRGGFEETGQRVENLLADDARKVAAVTGTPGSEINPLDVTKPVNRLKPTFANQVNPGADLSAINRAKSEFLDKHSTSAPYTTIAPNPYGGSGMVPTGSGVVKTKQPIPLDAAQAEKTGTYRQLRGKYGELGAADVEAQKALARGLREEIIKRVPGLNGARESDLIALEGQLSRFVGREGNKNIVGLIPAVVGAAGGAAVGHSVEGGVAGVLGTLAVLAIDNPNIKSRIAIALDRAKKAGPAASVGAGVAAPLAVAGKAGDSINQTLYQGNK